MDVSAGSPAATRRGGFTVRVRNQPQPLSLSPQPRPAIPHALPHPPRSARLTLSHEMATRPVAQPERVGGNHVDMFGTESRRNAAGRIHGPRAQPTTFVGVVVRNQPPPFPATKIPRHWRGVIPDLSLVPSAFFRLFLQKTLIFQFFLQIRLAMGGQMRYPTLVNARGVLCSRIANF